MVHSIAGSQNSQNDHDRASIASEFRVVASPLQIAHFVVG
jgi:uncharacterized membrane protein